MISLKRFTLIIGAAGALAVGIASPASAAPSSPPSCFGQETAGFATSAPQAVGTFVSAYATVGFSPPETSIGQTGVPSLKATCPSPPPPLP